THTYITNGTFTVTLIASNCLSSDTFTSVVEIASVGIEDEYQEKVKIIYDQSLDLLHVDMMENHGRWTIMDLQGRTLSQGQFIAGKNELSMNLYPNGIYLFRTEVKGIPFVFRFAKY
ncbi:MAG: PKD domain-containing protein, partial [Bacteroidetes bacterium]|nr:PKD domain-containing protein [Bacteroidota bacterium]